MGNEKVDTILVVTWVRGFTNDVFQWFNRETFELPSDYNQPIHIVEEGDSKFEVYTDDRMQLIKTNNHAIK